MSVHRQAHLVKISFERWKLPKFNRFAEKFLTVSNLKEYFLWEFNYAVLVAPMLQMSSFELVKLPKFNGFREKFSWSI